MTQINFKSAGVSARVINLTGPTAIQPVGIPAGVIGTSVKGPAYVPMTVATTQDFTVIFGLPDDNKANGPLAVGEWLRNRQAATFLRVLGVGQGQRRTQSGFNQGKVEGAGFVVGDQQPQVGGGLGDNIYANAGGPVGRLYFLNTFMSESNGSGFLTDAGLPGEGTPMVRAVIMAASGVILTLSSSLSGAANPSDAPAAGLVASEATVSGSALGTVNLSGGRQEFVLLLNGHKGTDSRYPNFITASFDIDAPNYLGGVLNTDPLNLEQAGHLLYADYSVHPNLAVVTGSSVISGSDEVLSGGLASGLEPIAFLSTGSLARNSGSTVAPSYENWEDRFATPKSTWIVSQKFGGKPKNLFRIHLLDDGAWGNDQVKWSVENITPAINDVNPYGTFDLLVRRFNDFDKKREVTEAWRGLSLNPSSDNYIARVIGDMHIFYNFDAAEGSQKLVVVGEYPNQSNVIRVEVSPEVENVELDASALPMGFRGVPHLVTSGTSPLAALGDLATNVLTTTVDPAWNVVQMPIPFRKNLNLGSVTSRRVDKGFYWGVQFERKLSVDEPNSTTEPERSILGFTKFYPKHQTDWLNVVVSDNNGVQDTVTNGVLDADRFNNNLFSLENIRIVRNTSTNLADTTQLVSWSYVRAGNVSTTGSFRALTADDLSDSSVRQVAKFNGIIQGGFDGVRIFDEDTANLTNLAIVEEMDNADRGISNGATVSAYNVALDIISDDTETDIQLLTIPGIRHEFITDRALQKVEERFDAMYIMDIPEYDTMNTLVTGAAQDLSVRFTANQHRNRGLNTSFGAVYFPDVIIRDTLNNTIRQVPPSVAVLGAFGLNDAIGFPWFAPAGFARGALQTTEEASIPLSRDNMDALQDVKINPLVSFAGSDGVVVWGQRTLLASDSALERVNVRRLLIQLRRDVRRVARRFVFEPGRAETLARFSQLVNPILKRVQDQRGVERFLVRIDTTTTTQADIENKTIRGKIFLVPTKTLEFLSIDFVVTNQGNFVTSA